MILLVNKHYCHNFIVIRPWLALPGGARAAAMAGWCFGGRYVLRPQATKTLHNTLPRSGGQAWPPLHLEQGAEGDGVVSSSMVNGPSETHDLES